MRLSLLQCTLGIGAFPIRICSRGQLQHRRREERDVARLLDCQHAGNSKTWQAPARLTSRRVAAVLMASLASPAFGHGLASSSSSSSSLLRLDTLRRGQREKRRFAVGLIYWRAFKFGDNIIANGYGDLLPLRIDATDSQFRRPLPIGCGLFFGYHVLYLLPDVKGSEPSLLHF